MKRLIPMPLVATALGLLLAAGFHTEAATWSVGASGCDFTNIASAVAFASVLDGDTIVISNAVHTEANITVNKSLTFRGQGMTSTILQAATNRNITTSPIFFLQNASYKAVTFRDMTLRYARNQNTMNGGAISCFWTGLSYTTTVVNCYFTMNDGQSAYGGGAIGNDGECDLTVSNCFFENNATSSGKSGGAIYSRKGNIRIYGSTFLANAGGDKGGAIYIELGAYPNLAARILNCTIVSNTAASQWAGGVHLSTVASSTALVANCTIVGNSALFGGGVAMEGAGRPEIHSTILATNLASNSGHDLFIYNGPALLTNSLLMNPAVLWQGSASLSAGSNVTNQNPKLYPLANNGGSTLTMALYADSPCIDKGSNPAGLARDQRGGRYERVFGAAADIGALEYGAGAIRGTVVITR